MLGLPDHVRACLFDLDGVLTETAVVHARAWKQMFDDYLRQRAERDGDDSADGADFVPFDAVADYDEYVDGKPRADGTRAFLRSRGIDLPEGSPDDPAGAETVAGLGRRKNDLVLQMIRTDGVRAYPGSVRFVHAVREAGLPCAVVSSSANCRDVLESAGIAELFDLRIDGVVAQQRHLRGKPAPDTYLAGARGLGQDPDRCAVFEDALAGVASGRAGDFGWVVGVDRVGQAQALREHGADIVVDDLADLLERR